jgi:hypothetical protein
VLDDIDGCAELLDIVGSDDTRWDHFALLLSPVGIHRLLEGSGVVREDDTVGQRQCKTFA